MIVPISRRARPPAGPGAVQCGSTMAAMSDRLSRALALKALQPLDGHGSADRVMTTRRSAAHLSPLHRLDHPVRANLRIRLCHLPLASAQPARLNQTLAGSGNPTPSRPKKQLSPLMPNSTQNFDAVSAHSVLVILAPGDGGLASNPTEIAGPEGAWTSLGGTYGSQ